MDLPLEPGVLVHVYHIVAERAPQREFILDFVREVGVRLLPELRLFGQQHASSELANHCLSFVDSVLRHQVREPRKLGLERWQPHPLNALGGEKVVFTRQFRFDKLLSYFAVFFIQFLERDPFGCWRRWKFALLLL